MGYRDFELPDGTFVEVPEDMPFDQADALAKQKYPDAYKGQVQPASKGGYNNIGSLISGVGNAVQVPGQLAGLAGLAAPDNALVQAGQGIKDYGQSLKSEERKEQELKIALAIQEAEKLGLSAEVTETLKQYASNPGVTLGKFVENLPFLVATMGSGLGAQLGAKALVAGIGKEGLKRAGVAGAAGAGATMQGADVGAETYDRVYKAAVAKGFTPEAAHERALEEARKAALKAGAVSGATMAFLPGAEKALMGMNPAKTALRGAGRTGLGESVQEAAEEGSGAYFANVGEQAVDPTVDTTRGVGSRATTGAILGGLMGGATGAYSGQQEARKLKTEARAIEDAESEAAASQEEEKKKQVEAAKDTPQALLKLDTDYAQTQAKLKEMRARVLAIGSPEKNSAEALEKAQLREAIRAYEKEIEPVVKEYTARKPEIERAKKDPLRYFLGEPAEDGVTAPPATGVNVDPDIARFVGEEAPAQDPTEAYVQQQATLAREATFGDKNAPIPEDDLNEYVGYILADPARAAEAVKAKAVIPGIPKKQSDAIMGLVKMQLDNVEAVKKAQEEKSVQDQADEIASARPDMPGFAPGTRPTKAQKATLPTDAWVAGLEEDAADAAKRKDVMALEGKLAGRTVASLPEGEYPPGEVLEDKGSMQQTQAYWRLREKYQAALAERAAAPQGSQEAIDANRRIRALRRAMDSLDVSKGASTVAPQKDFSGIDELLNRALEQPAGGAPTSQADLEAGVERLADTRKGLLTNFLQLAQERASLKQAFENIPSRDEVKLREKGTISINRVPEKQKQALEITKRMDAAKAEMVAAAVEEIKRQREAAGLVPLDMLDKRFSDEKLTQMLMLRINKAAEALETGMNAKTEPKTQEALVRQQGIARQIAAIRERLNRLTGNSFTRNERRATGAATAFAMDFPEREQEVVRLIKALNVLTQQQGLNYNEYRVARVLQDSVDRFALSKGLAKTRANAVKEAAKKGAGQVQRGEQAPILRERQYPGREVETGSTEFGKAYRMEGGEEKFQPTKDDEALVKRMREDEIKQLNDAVVEGRVTGENIDRVDRGIQQLVDRLDAPVTEADVARAKETYGYPKNQPLTGKNVGTGQPIADVRYEDQPLAVQAQIRAAAQDAYNATMEQRGPARDTQTADIFKEGLPQDVDRAGAAYDEAREAADTAKSQFGRALAGVRGKSPMQDVVDRLAQKFGKKPGGIAKTYAEAKAELERIRAQLPALKAAQDAARRDVYDAVDAKIKNDQAEAQARLRDTQRTVAAAIQRIKDKQNKAATPEAKKGLSVELQQLVEFQRKIRDELRPKLAEVGSPHTANDVYAKLKARSTEALSKVERTLKGVDARLRAIEDRALQPSEQQQLAWLEDKNAALTEDVRNLTERIDEETAWVADFNKKKAPTLAEIAKIEEQIAQTQKDIAQIAAVERETKKNTLLLVNESRPLHQRLKEAGDKWEELNNSLIENGMPSEEMAKDPRVVAVRKEFDAVSKEYLASIDAVRNSTPSPGSLKYVAEAESRYEASVERQKQLQRMLEGVYSTTLEEETGGKYEVTAPFGVAKEKPAPRKIKGTYGTAFDQAAVTQTDEARQARADKRLEQQARSGKFALNLEGTKEMVLDIPEETSIQDVQKIADWLEKRGWKEAAAQVRDDAPSVTLTLPKLKENADTAAVIAQARAQIEAAIRQGQRETAVRPQRSKASSTFRTGAKRGRPTKAAEAAGIQEAQADYEATVDAGDLKGVLYAPFSETEILETAKNLTPSYRLRYKGKSLFDYPLQTRVFLYGLDKHVANGKSVADWIKSEIANVKSDMELFEGDLQYLDVYEEDKQKLDFLEGLNPDDFSYTQEKLLAPARTPVLQNKAIAPAAATQIAKKPAIDHFIRQQGIREWDEKNPLHGLTLAEAAAYGEKNARNPLKKALFRTLAEVLKNSDGRVVAGYGTRPNGTRTNSFYVGQHNFVFMGSSYPDGKSNTNISILLHELVHAATSKGLTQNKALREAVDKVREQAAAWAQTKEGKKYTRSKFGLVHKLPDGSRGIYGLLNADEFLAETMSNARFQEFLQQIPSEVPRKNLFTRFVDAVSKFFGASSPTEIGLLRDAIEVAERAMNVTAEIQGQESGFETGEGVLYANPSYASPDIEEASNTFIGRDKSKLAAIREAASGLSIRTRFVDNYAALKEALKRGDATYAIQVTYDLMNYAQRNHMVQQSVMEGPPVRVKSKHKGKDVRMVEAQEGGPTLRRVSELLAAVKGFGNHQATSDAFTMYALAKRAQTRGWDRVFADTPFPVNASAETNQRIRAENAKKAKARAQADALVADKNSPFLAAYKEYQDWNKGMLQFAQQSGVIKEEDFRRLASEGNYTPLFRKDKHNNLVLEIDQGRDITVGRLADEPHLQKLLGGSGQVMDFFTASVRNASVLVDAALHNIASREAAFALQAMGAAHPVAPSEKGENIIEFRKNGDLQRFAVDTSDTDAADIPTDLLVKGFAGVPASLPGWVRMMGVPAQLLRKTVTRNPLYMFRQLVRDPLSAWLATGADMNPLTDTLAEVGKALTGKSDKTLDRRGITGGMLFSENDMDIERIQNEAKKAPAWSWGYWMAKLDHMAMGADAITRRNVYQGALREGASGIQATLAAYEAMPFSKRGSSPSVRTLNHMVPFLSAAIQGWDVLYRSAFTKDMPLADRVDIRNKLLARGAMIGGITMMYAMAMGDDDVYKNANTAERLSNWFVKLPGTDITIKLPTPFEYGILFKMIPEAMVRSATQDKDFGDEMRMVGGALWQMVPNVAIPQGIIPLVEASLNTSFFTGRPIEGRALQDIDIGLRADRNTSELSKLVGFDFEAFGTQWGISPKMLEHVLGQYTAGLYPAFAALIDTMLPAPTVDKPDRTLAELPLFKSALQQENAGGQVNRLYDKIDKFTRYSETFKKLVETNPVEAQEYMAENAENIAKGGMAAKMKAAIDKISNAENVVRNSTMTAAQKKEALDNFKRVKTNLSSQFASAL